MKSIFTFILATLASACSVQLDKSSSLAEWHNQQGSDITMLQAWIGQTVGVRGGVPGAGDLDPELCPVIRENTSQTRTGIMRTTAEVDCREEVEKQLALNLEVISPLITPAAHFLEYDEQNPQRRTISGKCEILEFRTITRDSALLAPTFHGIGFHLAGSLSSYEPYAFVSKDRLHAVGHVTLKDGSPATVHRFIAQGFCFQLGGTGGALSNRQYKFRPFAEFKADDNGSNFYRQWDNVEHDYQLGRSYDRYSYVFTRSFDRQSELLAD